MKKFYFLDGHSIIYRSFYAFIRNPLRNSKGMNTSAVYGFLNTILRIIKKFEPTYLAIAFDTGGETFRDKEYKDYKATRPETPDELTPQISIIQQIAETLGLLCLEKEGFEADDVLASLAEHFKVMGEVYIITSDKDLLQLVDRNVYVYDPYKEIIFDRAKVVERYGVEPKQIVDVLALAGDASDNIPGVPGVGEKRAVEVIKKHLSAEKAVEQDGKLRPHKAKVILYKKLLKVITDIDLKLAENDVSLKELNRAALLPILKELEFFSLIKEFAPKISEKTSYKALGSIDELRIKDRVSIYFDQTLMGGTFYFSTKLKTSFSISESQLKEFKPFLQNQKIKKIGFDLKTSIQELRKRKIPLALPIFDIGVAAWLIDANRKSFSVEDLALNYLDRIVQPGCPHQIVDLALELEPVLNKRLQAMDLVDLFATVEMELLYVLADMEGRGIKIDIPYFKKHQLALETDLAQIESVIYQLAGHKFNLNSPKQLSQVLFEELKLKPSKKRKTHYSTSYEVLVELAQVHALPKEMLKYRELSKLKSTYVDPIIHQALDSRLHTKFNQTGTATGRLSSSNPNIQNIPIRTDVGKKIREGFVADQGYKLVSADYSQVELRILASISGDKRLIDSFSNGEDIHNQTAAKIFDIKPKAVTAFQRRVAKVVNYGIIYGMSDYGLAQELMIPLPEAQAFIENYKAIYPKVQDWIEQAIQTAMDKGYAETIYKRKRPLPDINSQNRALAEFSKRAAINTPIQGTAADIIKMAMIKIYKLLKEKNFNGGLLLQIHDELLFEIEESRTAEAKKLIKEAMEKVVDLDVPIEVSIGIGQNWAEAH